MNPIQFCGEYQKRDRGLKQRQVKEGKQFSLQIWSINTCISSTKCLPALINAQSKLRSTVRFSLHFSLSSFKPYNRENTIIHVDNERDTNRQTGSQSDGQTDRQTDRQTGRPKQPGRQTDKPGFCKRIQRLTADCSRQLLWLWRDPCPSNQCACSLASRYDVNQ